MKEALFLILFFWSLSSQAFDHDHKEFNNILETYVTFQGKQSFVNYKELKKKESLLNSYLTELSGVKKKDFKKFNKNQRLSFLINAYNAFTLKIVIDHYPIKSIKDIGSLFKSTWKKRFFTLLEEKSHLDNIEHNLIRKNFNEPKIHFAVNCASIGCPTLLNEAFVAKKLEDQLEKATRSFLLNKNKNSIVKKKLRLSKIFKWYGDDFVQKHGSLENFIALYLTTDVNLQKNIKRGEFSIEWNEYDWDLNSL